MNCYICSSTRIVKFKSLGNYNLLKCKSCKVIFLDRASLTLTPIDYYDQKYFDDYLYDLQLNLNQVKNTLQFYINLISYYYYKPKKILDVGAGIGLMVRAFRELGFDADGIEISPYACKVAYEKFNLNLINDSLLNYMTDEKYDLIVFYHSFEHLENPVEYLRKVKSILNDGGLLWLSLPNVMSLDRFIMKNNWNGWSLPYHLFHYSPGSIKKLLNSNNYRRIKIVKGFLNPIKLLTKGNQSNSNNKINEPARFSPIKEIIRVPATLFFSNQNMNVFAVK